MSRVYYSAAYLVERSVLLMAVQKADYWAEQLEFRSVDRKDDPSAVMLAQKTAEQRDSCLVGLMAALWELPTVAWMVLQSAESSA